MAKKKTKPLTNDDHPDAIARMPEHLYWEQRTTICEMQIAKQNLEAATLNLKLMEKFTSIL